MSISAKLKELIVAFGGAESAAAIQGKRIDTLIGRLTDAVNAGGGGGGSAAIVSKGTLQSCSFNDVPAENATYALSALQTYTDAPVAGAFAGVLMQTNYDPGSSRCQIVYLENGEIYTRIYASSTWRSWRTADGPDALICEGSLNAQTNVYTLTTPLADIVAAYQAGRDVLLPIPISDGGSDTPPTYYIPAHAAISAGGVCIVTFLGVFHAEGETQYTRVMFAGEQTAEGEIETVYDGPLDVAFAVDMTQSPPTVSTTAETTSYSNVTDAIKAGRVVRAKISLGTVGENTEGFIYAPLQQYFRNTENDSISELRFAGVVDIGSEIDHIEIRWGGSTPSITPTPLTS